MAVGLRTLLPILLLAAAFQQPLRAQRSLSADVEIKQVAEGKVVTTRKHVCCSSSGRLVSFCSYPRELYCVQELRGATRIYSPQTGELVTDRSGDLSSGDDLMYFFLSRGIGDMGLTRLGYKLKGQTTDAEGYLKKTFTSTGKDCAPLVEVVYKNFLPVYIAHMSSDGTIRGKQFFSSYENLGRISFPSRSTEIVYTPSRDSVVVRIIYSGLAVDSPDPLLEFEIPADAKPAL